MTSYQEIYEIFAQKITDVKLMELNDEDIEQLLCGYLLSAVAKFKRCSSDLSKRDTELRSFNVVLSDNEKEILALMMVAEWLEPQVNSTLLTSQFIGSNHEKYYAQSNQLDKLMALSRTCKTEARKLIRDYTYQSYLDELQKN